MLKESRIIAKLLLSGADEGQWHKAIVVNNILQKKAPSSAKRQAKLLRNRLDAMPAELWRMVIDGSKEMATQALLAAAIKHSRLLGEFMDKIVRQHHKIFSKQLTTRDWTAFLSECEHRDSAVSSWSESTRKKLGQVVFRILAEAKYLDNTKSLNLVPVRVIPEIHSLLKKSQEDYVLRCMEVSK